MKKVFLDDLPRWGKGGRGREGTINWNECLGEKVKFIYDNIEGEIEILENLGEKIKIIYNNRIFDINKDSFKRCKLGNLLKKITKEFKIEIGMHFKDEKRDYVITGREYRSRENKSNINGDIFLKDEKWYKYHCNKCGWNEGWVIEYSVLHGYGCACCTNQVVVEGINDIPTTNPEMIKHFQGGYEEAKLYTRASSKKINTKCSICGESKVMSIYRIKGEEIVCQKCKGISIARNKNKCDEEDSFLQNDKCNRLKFWDYSKNKQLPEEVFKNSTKRFWFNCERGHSFKMSLSAINGKRSSWCPHCANIQKESRMATVLKQVFKHEFKNTIWEYDIGFKGFNGGTSHYDIYVPELNLLIECQSEYHDAKTELDLKKEKYALNKGYYFFSIDYRNQSVLEAIKIFFPYINKIPNYVDYTKETYCNWDIKKAQVLLDITDLTQKQIAEEVGADFGSFCDKVARKILLVPDDKRKETPVVQLDIEGNFIRKHDKASEFKKYGFNTPDISSCCKGRQHTHRSYIFMYEKDYNDVKDENGNIDLDKDYKKIVANTKKKKVLQIDLGGKIIKEYSSLSDVEKNTGFLVSNISACCSGVSKTSNGFIWVYKEEYEENPLYIKNIVDSAKPKMFKKAIACINLKDMLKHKIYESAREAERLTGIDYKTISYKCRKKHNNNDNCIWMFEEDFLYVSNDGVISIEKINKFKIDKYKLYNKGLYLTI